jgi:hypothetical protein
MRKKVNPANPAFLHFHIVAVFILSQNVREDYRVIFRANPIYLIYDSRSVSHTL